MLFECKLYTAYQVLPFLKLIHVQLAAGAVLLETLVPVYDLLVVEGSLLPEVLQHLRGDLALLLPHDHDAH